MSEINVGNCNQPNCPQVPCPTCETFETQKCPPTLATDCIVVDSLLCSQKVNMIAELSVPLTSLDDIISIGPGGVISPLLTLTPDINGITSQITIVKDMIITTGFLPASITILGLETPLQINIPFQQETVCPGVCPEDNVQESPYKIEAVVTQGIEALGISVANILFKVIISTNVTATRPVITKAPNLQVVRDVNADRCSQDDSNG